MILNAELIVSFLVHAYDNVKKKTKILFTHRLLMQKKLHKFELASLANLCPESADEAKALVPR